jgi:hypothetical protein
MDGQPDFIISDEQSMLFAQAIAGDIEEYVKNHQAEYELFLLNEKD